MKQTLIAIVKQKYCGYNNETNRRLQYKSNNILYGAIAGNYNPLTDTKIEPDVAKSNNGVILTPTGKNKNMNTVLVIIFIMILFSLLIKCFLI